MADILIDDAVFTNGRTVGGRLGDAVSVRDFGAVGDGVTEDTVAFQAALDSAGTVYVPSGRYLVGTLAPPERSSLYGNAATSYSSSGTAPELPLPVLLAKAGASPMFDMGGRSRFTLRGLSLYGANQTGSCVAGGDNVAIHDCRIFKFSTGINSIAGDYPGVYTITNCTMRQNNIAIRNPVDCIITNCYLADNATNGITGAAGSNDNIIANCKVEWNGQEGIYFFDSVSNLIMGCVFDRNGYAGVRLVRCNHCKVLGWTARRNGRNASADEELNCHFCIEEGTANTVDTGSTATGHDDTTNDGDADPLNDSTNNTPAQAVTLKGTMSKFRLGGDLSGGMTTSIYRESFANSAGSVMTLLQADDTYGLTYPPGPQIFTIAALGNQNYVFTHPPIAGFTVWPIHLHLTLRRVSGATGREYIVWQGTLWRESGGGNIGWVTAGIASAGTQAGPAIPGISNDIRVGTPTIATDASTLTFNVTNNHATDSYTVTLWLTP